MSKHQKRPEMKEVREEYREYLEKHGVLQVFSKILAKLHDENPKPAKPLEFVQKEIGALTPQITDLQTEIGRLRLKNSRLELENHNLRSQLEQGDAKINKVPQPPVLQGPTQLKTNDFSTKPPPQPNVEHLPIQ